MSDIEGSSKRSVTLVITGFVLSFAYFVFVSVLAWSSWAELWDLEPNEFGDLMAGTFAPLAFLWLVLGFFQQGQELRASVEALKLQGKELRNSVEQQRDLVRATREEIEMQAKRIEHEDAQRDREVSPVFDLIEAGRSHLAGGDAQVNFRLVNHGQKVTKVVAQSIDGSKTWGTANKLEGNSHIGFPMIVEYGTDVREVIRVTYIDALNRPGSRDFVVNSEKAVVTIRPDHGD